MSEKSGNNESSEPRSAEDHWFSGGGEPVDEDHIDEELLKLARRPSWLELCLYAVVIVFCLYISRTLLPDAMYYLEADREPVELGAVENISPLLQENPQYLVELGSNVFVSLEGIPSRRSETKDHQYAQLIGAPIFVQQDHELADVDPLLREATPAYGPHDERHTRYYIDGPGRLRHFDDLTGRHRGIVGFYTTGYGIWFCGEELTHDQQQFQRTLAEEARGTLYEELGRDATQAEIDAAVAADFSCEEGFLFEAGQAPDDYLSETIIFFGLFGVVALCLGFVGWWVKRYRRSL